MSDFANNAGPAAGNVFGIPQLHLDPSLMPAAPPAPNLAAPAGIGGGSPAALSNVFGHLTDPPAAAPALTPDLTVGAGSRVGDPSSFAYNLARGALTLGADQTGQVSAGLNLPSGTTIGAGLSPAGVVQGQLGQNFAVGGGQLTAQANAATDGTLGGSLAFQRGNVRVGLNGGVNTTTGDANIGGGVGVRF
jgi:hypothetical protein